MAKEYILFRTVFETDKQSYKFNDRLKISVEEHSCTAAYCHTQNQAQMIVCVHTMCTYTYTETRHICQCTETCISM